MAATWEANEDIKRKLREIKKEFHPHLTLASIWVLCSDGNAIRDNHVIATKTQKCTRTEKLSSGHDFKITIMMETWAHLTDKAREIALDEALCRCGVRYVPLKMEINGRKEIVKDEVGRTVFTSEIQYDRENNPKWKINQPDAALYFDLLMRRGTYSEEADNTSRALQNKPIKSPQPAEESKDLVTMDINTKVDAEAPVL